MIVDHYTYEKKMALEQRISKIDPKKKRILFGVYRIIQAHKGNCTVNENGTYVYFHMLSDEAYSELSAFMDKVEAYLQQKTAEKISTGTTDQCNNTYEFSNSEKDELCDSSTCDGKFKYSTKEKNFMRRIQYVKNIEFENGVNEEIEYKEYTPA